MTKVVKKLYRLLIIVGIHRVLSSPVPIVGKRSDKVMNINPLTFGVPSESSWV